MPMSPTNDTALPTALQKGKVWWLASYPKSGNTWVKTILNEILGYDEYGQNKILTFQKTYPSDAPLLTIRGEKVKLLKTHLHPKNPRMALCTDETCGAITIRRHPLDILLSSLNYAGLKGIERHFKNGKIKSVEEIIEDGEFPYYIEQFAANDGFPWFTGPCGPMSDYMRKWREVGKKVPNIELCYESMVANPETGIQELAKFLGIDLSEGKLQNVAAAADKRTAQNGNFFWKRRAYNFTHMLPDDMIKLFKNTCEPQLRGFGY